MRLLPALLAASLMLFAGCGFHLRGQLDVPPAMQRIYLDVAGGPGSPLHRELERVLLINGIHPVKTPAEAGARLAVGPEHSEKRLLVKGTQGSAVEYEIRYSLPYTLSGSDGKPLMPADTIQLSRDLLYSESAVLGRDTGETRAINDMRSEAVQAIMRRAAAQAR
ncbi:LPS assembly lipoprotein LptE [Plasticicumulans acidivorans]|uniref:LPS-assembly lipoprotein LptE n=1 Tax=Plasticicumulans acidivorans TaxID=886464 RepID=A0A317MS86_9GAMM|nr:LPS assembly lipoprotein LptE [Plasticicumulans acidivorans]PWV59337.1 LPS-assembly lipoprotein [Plasticicumulans acidivorans]